MKNILFTFFVLSIYSSSSLSGWFSTNYEECILDNMPGAKNKQAREMLDELILKLIN